MQNRYDIKRQVLSQALLHVPFEGWSKELLARAASDAGFDPSYEWRLFPHGVRDAITCWSQDLDEDMVQALPSPETLRVRERVALAVKTRLTLLAPHREAARKTVVYLARPHHLGQAAKLTFKTVSDIWYYAGDTSTDYNYYTKRG